MALQKHLGVTNLGTRITIINWKLPNTEFALIVETESLPPRYQDAFVELVGGIAQSTNENLDNLLSRNRFPSGENMLQALHANGFLHKVLIDNIQMFVDTAGKKMELRDIVDASEGVPATTPAPAPEASPEEAAAAVVKAMTEAPVRMDTPAVETLVAPDTPFNDVAALQETVAQLTATVETMHKDLLSMKPKKRGRPPKVNPDA